MRLRRVGLVALLLAGACAPLRPVSESTPYGDPQKDSSNDPAPAAEPDFEPPMGWVVVTAEDCGISFAMPAEPERVDQTRADGVHAVYTHQVDETRSLSVDCALTPGAAPVSAEELRASLVPLADDGEVYDLGPFQVGDAKGHGFQIKVKDVTHRYRVVVLGGRRVQLQVIGSSEYPGLYQSVSPVEAP